MAASLRPSPTPSASWWLCPSCNTLHLLLTRACDRCGEPRQPEQRERAETGLEGVAAA